MGIKADFSFDNVIDLFNAIPDIIEKYVVENLSYLGEECVIRIRDRSGEESWNDQSHNLRGSIGYSVYKNGSVAIESSFEYVTKGQDGIKEGKKAIVELATKYADNQYTLVVLAGMEYAEYVEAMENKDVLASTELWARTQVDDCLKKAIEKAEKEITRLQKQLGL